MPADRLDSSTNRCLLVLHEVPLGAAPLGNKRSNKGAYTRPDVSEVCMYMYTGKM